MGTTSLPFSGSQHLSPPLPLNLHMALNGAQLLGSRLPRKRGLPYVQFLAVRQGSLSVRKVPGWWQKFALWTCVFLCCGTWDSLFINGKSDFFGGEGLCCYVLWGWESRLFWHGILPIRGTLKARLRVKEAQPASKIIVFQWPLQKAGPQH